jgi:flagellar M-ring protein FliF
MRETADRMLSQIREYLAGMPRGRKIQMAILFLVIIALSIVAVVLLTRTNWVVLPGTGDPTSTSHIYAALTEMGIPTRVEGNQILVPEDRLGDIQMRLRDQGLLGAANFDWDLHLPDASGFGVTDSHAKRLYDAQLGENIRTLILQSNRISNALVIVTSGETSPFRIATNARQSQATIMLTLRGGGMLTPSEAQTIGDIVKNAVPGIEYENMSISDSELNFYRVGDANQDLDLEIGQRAALTNRLTGQIKGSVEQLLSPIFGIRNLEILPHVRLNFDRAHTERIEFAPPIPGEMEGIVRSSERIYENSRRFMDAEGIPGTDTNQMGTVEYPYGTLEDGYEYARAVLSNNYEINQTTTLIEHERGSIEYLSISVLINSLTEGVEADFSDEVADLVAKGIGVAPGNIAVHLIPFAYEDTTLADMYAQMAEEEAARRNRELFETILMYVVILLLGVMVLLLGRSIIRAVRPPPEPDAVLVAAGPGGFDILLDDEPGDEKDIEDIELQSKSTGLEQIERFIDKDSASVAQLLRNWLSDE